MAVPLVDQGYLVLLRLPYFARPKIRLEVRTTTATFPIRRFLDPPTDHFQIGGTGRMSPKPRSEVLLHSLPLCVLEKTTAAAFGSMSNVRGQRQGILLLEENQICATYRRTAVYIEFLLKGTALK